MLLVIGSNQPILSSMGLISWCRERFSLTREGASAVLPDAREEAEQGNPQAQFALGLQYSIGKEISCDLDQAAQWYRRAAVQDHALAQFHLGLMYANGRGVERNDGDAIGWIRRSAEGGEAGAQFHLGSRYHRHSVRREQMDSSESRVEAYKWFHLAAAQGYQGSAAACERLTLTMTRAEVADGNERVAAFVVRSSAPGTITFSTPTPE